MVPACSDKVPRVSSYSGYCLLLFDFGYEAFTLFGRLFQNRSPIYQLTYCSPNPMLHATWFGLFPFRSPLLWESLVVFSSSGYLDVSVHRVPSVQLWIGCTVTEVCSAGFPHSEICGSMVICTSPQLFAAYYVLHRLSQCQGIHPTLLLVDQLRLSTDGNLWISFQGCSVIPAGLWPFS